MTKNRALTFSLMLILVTLACGSTTPLPATEPVSVTYVSPTPEQTVSSTEEPDSITEQIVSVPGLRVVYIHAGNLWSWTEAGGVAQLTNTDDMSTIRVSDDGQLLAFMRGREIWKVRMDGTDARLLYTQAEEGGALWFSPSGSLLAVSTANHIDVIDLNTSSTATILTYPAIANGFFPEIIWTPDSFGFKTVIPPQAEIGQAEFLFIFTDGTVASLAKFAMVSLFESFPFISPDGGYVIYVAKLGDGKESLYLMDSSGATRPYGEPAASVRTYGWLPDSKRFMFGLDEPLRTFIGNVSGPPTYNETIFPPTVRWVDNEHYLAIDSGILILGDLSRAQTLISSSVSDFDIAP